MSSAAFKDSTPGGMSMHLAAETTLETVTTRYPDHGVVAITAGLPRSLGLNLVPDPVKCEADPSKDDPSHALVCPKASQGAAKKLAKNATEQILVFKPVPKPLSAPPFSGETSPPQSRPAVTMPEPPQTGSPTSTPATRVCVTCGNERASRTGLHIRACPRGLPLSTRPSVAGLPPLSDLWPSHGSSMCIVVRRHLI